MEKKPRKLITVAKRNIIVYPINQYNIVFASMSSKKVLNLSFLTIILKNISPVAMGIKSISGRAKKALKILGR